jgi:hypothetical protein
MKIEMKTEKLIKTIFCANEQVETDHVLSSSPSGEIVATCKCGRILKFPAGIKKVDFDKLIKEHKEANEGQVKQEDIDKKLAELAE